MKPANFPERRRQRQLRALARRPKDENEVLILMERTRMVLRTIRSKKDRSAYAKFSR